MYKLTDNQSGTIHEMNEIQIISYLKDELGMVDADSLEIEEIQDILASHDYTLELK